MKLGSLALILVPLIWSSCKQRTSRSLAQSSEEASIRPVAGELQCGGGQCKDAQDEVVRALASIYEDRDDQGEPKLNLNPGLETPEQRLESITRLENELKQRKNEILKIHPNAKIKVMNCSRTIVQHTREVARRDPKTGDHGTRFTGATIYNEWRARIFIIFQSYSEDAVRDRCRYLFERDPAIAKLYPSRSPPYDIVTYSKKDDYDFTVTEQSVDDTIADIVAKLNKEREKAYKDSIFTIRIDHYYTAAWTLLYKNKEPLELYYVKWQEAHEGCASYGYKVASESELQLLRSEIDGFLNTTPHINVKKDDRGFWIENARTKRGTFVGDNFKKFFTDTGETMSYDVGTFDSNPRAFVACMYFRNEWLATAQTKPPQRRRGIVLVD